MKSSGPLPLLRGGGSFAELGGLDALKSFCSAPCGRAGPRACGLAACSCWGRPARAGASSAGRWGAETGRPTLVLDVGSFARLAGGAERVRPV